MAAGTLAACGSQAAPSPPARPPAAAAVAAFRSAHDPEAPVHLWAIGDGADGGDAARAVARHVAGDRPDRLLYLGDVYEQGTPAEFGANFADVYGSLVQRTAPTPGNHEWPAHRQGYDPFWRAATGAPTPPWYAFRIGGWRVISLNSEADHGPGSAQLRWLRGQLRAGEGTCTLAFWHRPRHSAGLHGDQADVAPLWDALRGHASLVLNGHDHDLQRFTPVDGLTQLVVGAGGKSHYAVRSDRRLAFADDTHDGALRLTLRPGSAALRMVSAQGRTLDRSRVGCRPRTG